MSQPPLEHHFDTQFIAERYQIGDTIGQGGMAVVLKVFDTVTSRTLALKRMRSRESKQSFHETAKLFENEFYTLSQLAHPRVVEVYDYGMDGQLPYYTMEYLGGNDLRERSPLPWRMVCSILFEISSCLSFLHSRRLIHRDLSTRNIRFTPDEVPKLIDFGTVVPMGHCKKLRGTPPFTPPEAVNLQTLDARVDLFSLGAAAYYTLTGRHAYPARNFSDLRDFWRSNIVPPSKYVEQIPKELDSLILSLISLDAKARPRSAGEVMERLSAVAGLQIDEQMMVSQAYLSIPALVGRKKSLLHVRQRVINSQRGKGHSILIQGETGVGRSRFLDACVLEGKLAGATVIRADATDAYKGDYGVVQSLVNSLIESLPESVSKFVSPYFPASHSRCDDCVEDIRDATASEPCELEEGLTGKKQKKDETVEYTNSTLKTKAVTYFSYRPPKPMNSSDGFSLLSCNTNLPARSRIQSNLKQWFCDVSIDHGLLIAIDDLHLIDEPSAAMLALLAHETQKHRIVIAATVQTNNNRSNHDAMQLFAEISTNIFLKNLGYPQICELTRSLFGAADNIDSLAKKLYSLSAGNPAKLMELAQHLVDRQLIHYRAGMWLLPHQLDSEDLPRSYTEALYAKVSRLSSDARRLAVAMSLCPDQSYSLGDCKHLIGLEEKFLVQLVLDELIAFNILTKVDWEYMFASQVWVSVLATDISESAKKSWYLRLAEVFHHSRKDDFRIAQLLLKGGKKNHALDLLVSFCDRANLRLEESAEATYNFIHTLPADWKETLTSAIESCYQMARGRRDIYVLQRALFSFDVVSGSLDNNNLANHFEQLIQDSGLDFYYQLDGLVQESNRLSHSLQLAQQRYDQTEPEKRIVAPIEAIEQLSRGVTQAASSYAWALDLSLIESLPSIKPLVPLSPALYIVDKLIQHIGDLVAGKNEQCYYGFLEILQRIEAPDRAGLDETVGKYMRLAIIYALGLIEASLGVQSALRWADALETEPLHQVNAWRIRTVFYIFQGDFEIAEKCRLSTEQLRIQNNTIQFYEGTSLYLELIGYATADDMLGVKQVIKGIDRMSQRFSGWKPMFHWARGEYRRICGEYSAALDDLKIAIQITAPGRHQVWSFAVSAHLKVLLELFRFEEVIVHAEEYLRQCKSANLGYMISFLKIQLALSQARLSQFSTAVDLCSEVISHYHSLGVVGLYLGYSYENRARIAIYEGQTEEFIRYATLCAQEYKTGKNPALTTKFQKLIAEARDAEMCIPNALANATFSQRSDYSVQHRKLDEFLSNCVGLKERASRSLEMLVKQSGATHGFLYTIQDEGLVLSAESSDRSAPIGLDELVQNYLFSEIENADDVTITDNDNEQLIEESAEWTGYRDIMYRPLLLRHFNETCYAITGLVVLCRHRDKLLKIPWESTAIISKSLLEAGDVRGFLEKGF